LRPKHLKRFRDEFLGLVSCPAMPGSLFTEKAKAFKLSRAEVEIACLKN